MNCSFLGNDQEYCRWNELPQEGSLNPQEWKRYSLICFIYEDLRC